MVSKSGQYFHCLKIESIDIIRYTAHTHGVMGVLLVVK